MDITVHCSAALTKAGLFENTAHQSRFADLVSCFNRYPFFSRGLCKCMYLSAWDDEHFLVMLEVLNAMVIGGNRDTQVMSDDRPDLESDWDTDSRLIMQLSDAWLNNRPCEISMDLLSEAGRHIIERGFAASEIIDHIFDKAYSQS